MENEEDIEKIEEMIMEEGKKNSPSKKVLMCPVCRSSNIMYYLGGQTGYIYQCKDCDYIGAFILEK